MVRRGEEVIGRRFSIQGRVQGVGFRDFVHREARNRGLTGYVRNLSDGSVLVCAVGPEKRVAELESLLHRGPQWADVRRVDAEEMPAQPFDEFRIVF